MQILKQDHPLLHKPSTLATEQQLREKCEELKPIAALLIKTMDDHQALGVSACQIGIDSAMFAMNVDGNIKVCINPQVVAASVDMAKDEEGCLSFPGLFMRINRPAAVVVRYHDVDGNEVTEQLDGLAARVWLHEYDHTQGICFTDRASKLTLNMARKKLAKATKKRIRK